MLHKASTVIVLIVLWLNAYLAGLVRGYGFHQEFEFSEPYMKGAEYFTICFLLLVVIAVRFIRKKLLSDILCLTALSVALFQYRFIWLYKLALSDEGPPLSLLFRESIPLEIASFLLIITLLIYQFVVLLKGTAIRD